MGVIEGLKERLEGWRLSGTGGKLPAMIVALFFWGSILAVPAPAQEASSHFELGEIVVTATGVRDEIRALPKNVTVITSEEIERAPSHNVVDLLARETDVNLRSFFGHDKWGGVDIRGMGDTFVSNVLIMVDGVRLNPPDLAGADLSAVPLDQIERIEILRGSGAVLYGDGAVGGVVNIITKKGDHPPVFRLAASSGDYETGEAQASYGGRVGPFQFNLTGSCFDSSGYRDNGGLRKKDAGIYLGYELSERWTVFISAAEHRDKYGLPGPISKEDAENRAWRRQTDSPRDGGETEDQRSRGGFTLDFDRWGLVSVQVGLRDRENEYILGYSPLLTEAEQTSYIDEDSENLEMSYVKEYRLGGLDHRFQAGFDYFFTDYQRTELGRNRRFNSRLKRQGWFVLNKWSLPYHFSVQAGYRLSVFEGKFREDERQTFGEQQVWVNGLAFKREWRSDSYDLGLVYSPSPVFDLYAGYATSFRTPNTDEFALADEDLRPQRGEHLELGVRRTFARRAEISLSLFQIRMEDEIYYGEDPRTRITVNRNYDQSTIRRGIEAEVKLHAGPSWNCWGNVSLMEARFEGSGAFVPLVPGFKAGLGVEYHPTEACLAALTGTLVGDRYDGNDQSNNQYDRLEPYAVVDAKLSYQYRHLRFFLSVNNLFDRLYSTIGYSETYYPMPGRNFLAGIEIKL